MENAELMTSQLNFIGKVLCVFSHEINNQLAVLKESIGLIGDLIELGKTSRKDLNEMSEIIASIRTQITKTAYFCKNLSSFGRGMEGTLSSFDLNKSVEELIVLLNRLAGQKRITLEKDLKNNIPLVHGNPLKLQFLLYYFIEKNLIRLKENSKVIIKTSNPDGHLRISIIPKGDFAGIDDKAGGDELCHSFAANFGMTISREGTEGVTITLPLSPPAK